MCALLHRFICLIFRRDNFTALALLFYWLADSLRILFHLDYFGCECAKTHFQQAMVKLMLCPLAITFSINLRESSSHSFTKQTF